MTVVWYGHGMASQLLKEREREITLIGRVSTVTRKAVTKQKQNLKLARAARSTTHVISKRNASNLTSGKSLFIFHDTQIFISEEDSGEKK